MTAYKDMLRGLFIEFLREMTDKAKREKLIGGAHAKGKCGPKGEHLCEADRLDFNAEDGLTEKGLRQLHEEICRQSGMTADQVVAEWNERCPEDPW